MLILLVLTLIYCDNEFSFHLVYIEYLPANLTNLYQHVEIKIAAKSRVFRYYMFCLIYYSIGS